MLQTGEHISKNIIQTYEFQNQITRKLYENRELDILQQEAVGQLNGFSQEKTYIHAWALVKWYVREAQSGNHDEESSRIMLKKAENRMQDVQRALFLELGTDWQGLKVLFLFFIALIVILMVIFFVSVREDIQKKTQTRMNETHKQKMIHQLEEERNLVAYHLHDDLAQSLVFIQTYLESENEDYLRSKKDQACHLSGEVLNSIRNLSRSLRAPRLYESGFNDILKGLCEDINSLTSMHIHYNFIGTSHLVPDEDQFLHIYRITQELLNNGIKHSKGEKMDIRFLHSHPMLIIQYSDDGIGLDNPSPKKNSRLGMTGMQYRCRILNAKSSFSTGPQGGALVRIEIPLGEGKNERNSDY